jgi:hypothetical protein
MKKNCERADSHRLTEHPVSVAPAKTHVMGSGYSAL